MVVNGKLVNAVSNACRDFTKLGFVTAAIAGLQPAICSSALAADALEEVVVTARKRAESLQDIPATVQAFSETLIEDAGIERASDFLALTPNVMMLDIQDAGSAFLTIRGITSNSNTEQSVAVVYDGVLTTSPTALTQELFDIQQIEILKGPQGALADICWESKGFCGGQNFRDPQGPVTSIYSSRLCDRGFLRAVAIRARVVGTG